MPLSARARRRAGMRHHPIHQAGAGPIGGEVETGLACFGAGLAVAGEGGVDQPVVQRGKPFVVGSELLAHRQRLVGDENIGLLDEVVQDLLSGRRGEVECEATFVAVVQQPAVIVVRLRHAGMPGHMPIGIAGAWRLDLDDVGAEVGQHGARDCRGDEAAAVDDFQPFKNSGHRFSSLWCWARFSRIRNNSPDAGCQARRHVIPGSSRLHPPGSLVPKCCVRHRRRGRQRAPRYPRR